MDSSRLLETSLENVDTSAMGQSSIMTYQLDLFGADFGFFYFLSLGCVFLLLNQLDGKLYRLRQFLVERDFKLIGNRQLAAATNFILKILCYCFMGMPPLTLAVWTAALIKKATQTGESPAGGIGVLLVGLAYLFLIYSVLMIKWNNFKYMRKNLIMLILGYAFITSYQFIAVFLDSQKSAFFGYTTIFLSLNCMVVIFIIYLNHGVKGASMSEFMATRLKQGQPRDPLRDDEFKDEIDKEKHDPQYFPTYSDVIDLFTAATVNEQKTVSAYGGGIQKLYSQIPPIKRKLLNLLMWAVSLAIIIVYGFVIYWELDYSKLGFVTMFAVFTTDVILYFIQNAKVVKSTTLLCVITILNRFFLFIFGGDYWIYGYMVLYIFYGVILAIGIGAQRFPFEDALTQVKVHKVKKNDHKVNLAKIPEVVLALVTGIMIILFVVMAAVRPSGVPLLDLTIGSNSYAFYWVGVFALLFVIAFTCLYCTFRIFRRKQKDIKSTYQYYFQAKGFDRYWLFMLMSLFMLSAFSLLGYWATNKASFIIVGVLGALCLLCFLNCYVYYSINGFYVLENVKSLNTKIDKHNRRVSKLKSKVAQIRQQVSDGQCQYISEQQIGLAQNILQQNRKEKKKARINNLDQSQLKDAIAKQIQLNMNQKPDQSQTVQRNEKIKFQFYSKGMAGLLNKSREKNYKQNSEDEVQVQDDADEHDFEKDCDVIEEGGESNVSDNQDQSQFVDKSNLDHAKEPIKEMPEDQSSDEEIDPLLEEDPIKRECKKMKHLEDWRDTQNFFQAYFRRNLRSNDYQIIHSMVSAFISLVLMALLVSLEEGSSVGVTIAIPFLHYGMAFFSLVRHLSTDSKLSAVEITFFFLSYAIQYAWGIIFLFLTFDESERDVTGPGSSIAGLYIVTYLIVLPFITSFFSAIFKWIDDNGNITKMFLVQLALMLAQGLAMIICAFIFMTYIQGVVVLVFIVVISYILIQGYIYKKNDFYMPTVWIIVNSVLIFLGVIAPFIVQFFIENLLAFEGISISIWILSFFIFLYAVTTISADIRNIEQRPIFFSPWIFPVYVFNPKKNNLEKRNLPSIAMLSGFAIMIGWSVLCSVWVEPAYIGVSLCIMFQLIMVLCILYLGSVSQLHFKSMQPFVNDNIIKLAWLDAKSGYINDRNGSNREQLTTYAIIREREENFRNYIRIQEGRQSLNYFDKQAQIKLIDVEDLDIEWLDEETVAMDDTSSCYAFLFQIEKEMKNIYVEELELIIQFQLLIVQQAENLQTQERKYLFRFLNERKAALFALKIVIHTPQEGSMSVRYARVIAQLQKLAPEKRTMFNYMRESFIEEQKRAKEKQNEMALAEQEKEFERQQAASIKSKQKREALIHITDDMTVDEMPDCEKRYQRILKEKSPDNLFEDKVFGHDNESLGDGCLNRGVAKWVRASDNKNNVLYKDGCSHLDVVQGALGDCYFLSAISVLGEMWIKDIIVTIENEEEWRKCGAFCVKFFKDGFLEYVIIDDYFPAYPNDRWVFVQGGKEGEELWPMVLEKAYAKLYGTYNYIEAGKIQYALSDLTDGFPEQIDLKTDGKNIQLLWEKIKSLKSHGGMMGAGSPEHAMGDRAINEMGIVQGHAYAVIRTEEVDGVKLMQLCNPHGSKGVEWNGDWSDDSEKWTERFRNKIGHEETEASQDGVFWMEIVDFVDQFSYIYICRILDEDDGWKEILVNGQWKGKTAEGLPTRQNPTAKLEYNPQYEIVINKPCNGFVMLEQKDQVNMFKGKHNIFFMVSKCNGERISKVEKDAMVCRSGAPTNLNIVTSECDFDKSVSYPYKFTLMIANAAHGEEGEGDFYFGVYSTDPEMKVNELPHPLD